MLYKILFCSILLSLVRGQSNEVCLTLTRAGGESIPPLAAQGRPGRIGPQGPPGLKGDSVAGPPGECACVPSEIDQLNEKIRNLQDFNSNLVSKPLFRDTYCTVGMKDGRVKNADITASGFAHRGMEAYRGRLDNQVQGGHQGAWASEPPLRPGVRWIQVDLKIPTSVIGIITQGRPLRSDAQWVTGYKISYGNSTDQLHFIQSNGEDLIFQGNRDQSSKVTNLFPEPVVARYMRLVAQSWHGHITLRLEYLTC